MEEKLLDHAKETLSAELTARKDRTAGEIESVAEGLRSSTDADYIGKAASQVDRFAQYLKGVRVDDLMNDVDRLARREPVLFLGGAFAVGLLVSRFFKASEHGVSYDPMAFEGGR
jgi:hypothetical protein